MSSDEARFFAEHGYLVVRGAVDRARVALLESALDSLRATLPEAEPGAIWEVAGLSRAHPALAEHARDAELGALAAELLGCDAIQLLQDTALVKPALVGGGVAWHRDHTYTGYLCPPRLVSVRLALTACTRETGCLEVQSGSHLSEPSSELRPFTDARVEELESERALDARAQIALLELEPGDLSVHHCLTLHRSGPNRAPTPRKTLITRLFDARCSLLASALPAGAREHFPTADGEHLDPDAFPVVFTRARSGSPRST